jgi:hypothetical protein
VLIGRQQRQVEYLVNRLDRLSGWCPSACPGVGRYRC